MDANKLACSVPVPSWWSSELFFQGKLAIERAAAKEMPDFWSGKIKVLSRSWWFRETRDADIHPAVLTALQWCPHNWQTLLLEWPHASDEGVHRLAYTPNEDYGNAIPPRQIVTSIGKYLKRHWPHVPDHLIRDIAARYTPDEFKLLTTTRQMVDAAVNGPKSCMSEPSDYDCDDEDSHHPYEVYAPKFGWHMAVRMAGGKIAGRALCLTHEDKKTFVRTYARRSDTESYSSRDEALEAWLEREGYRHKNHWPDGAKLARLPGYDDAPFLAPYLDADYDAHRRVDDLGAYLQICHDDGEWLFDSPEAIPKSREPEHSCEDCGDAIYEDDPRIWAGPEGVECVVCGSCADDYRLVLGEGRFGRNRQYWVHYSGAVEVIGLDDPVDRNNPPESVVTLANGELACDESVEVVVVKDLLYLADDLNIVELALPTRNNETHALMDDAWMCTRTNQWYTYDQVQPVILPNGAAIHPDEVTEVTEVTEDDAVEGQMKTLKEWLSTPEPLTTI